MNPSRYPNEGYAADASTLFTVAAGWLTFLAAGMAVDLIRAGGSGSQVAGLLITAGAAVAAVAFFLLARRLRRREQANLPLELRAQIRPLPGSPRQLDKAA